MAARDGRWLLRTGAWLLGASLAALAGLQWHGPMPWPVDELLSAFVEPGAAAWRLVLEGPAGAVPDGAAGIVFAALANALCWLGAAGVAVAIGRALWGR